MVCVGAVEEYWVQGFNGHSDFEWRIIGPDGSDVSSSFYTVVGRGDTIMVYWNEALAGGIYTFEVVEHSDYGCVGEPYTQHILLNSQEIYLPFDGVPESVTICFGDIAELNPGQFQSYLWQDGSTNNIFYTGEAGTYQVQLINSQYECTYNVMESFVNPLPIVWLGNDTLLFGNQTLLLDVNDPSIVTYQWYKYDYRQGEWGNTPFHFASSYTVEGGLGKQYISVYVTDYNGCSNADSIFVDAANYRQLRIPKAFIPLSNVWENQKWYFPAPTKEGTELFGYLDDVEVRVFNRWGKLVWQSDGVYDESTAWDGNDLGGRPLPMDSYHYIIRIKVDGDVFLYKGSVTIVR